MTNSVSNAVALEDRFEVLKEIGDGSFGSVVLARVRAAGSSVARRNTVVCIGLMECYERGLTIA
jgi:meiosis induction protein kinase IME2/SME1